MFQLYHNKRFFQDILVNIYNFFQFQQNILAKIYTFHQITTFYPNYLIFLIISILVFNLTIIFILSSLIIYFFNFYDFSTKHLFIFNNLISLKKHVDKVDKSVYKLNYHTKNRYFNIFPHTSYPHYLHLDVDNLFFIVLN